MIELKKLDIPLVLAEAQELNFYGKRKRDSRLECAEDIISSTCLDLEPLDLVQWLDANKPEKPAASDKRKTASDKPAANTLVSGLVKVEELPLLETHGQGLIVTAAQNNTAINAEAWQALQAFAIEQNAKLAVMPIYYNKNAFSAAVECERERFADELAPFMVLDDHDVFGAGMVTLRPTAAVLPTAKLPVNAAATLNAGELLTVVAATKQQLKTLVSSPSIAIREAWASGCVTQINYARGRAGSEAATEHVYGGVYIQNLNGVLYARNLVFLDGKICDRDTLDLASEYAVVLGDLHCERKDPKIWQKTLDEVNKIVPSLIVVHDILHFEVVSHHNINNGSHLYKMRDREVVEDLRVVINDLNTLAEIAPVYVVESNHNSALDQWIANVGYNVKRDPRQAKIYYLLNYLVCEAFDDSDRAGQQALQVAFENLEKFGDFPELSDRVTFGNMDQAFLFNGVDCSQHGHKGQNGSTGSTALFSKWGTPMITGHTHSPALLGGAANGVLTVGVTASLKQGYNRGGGSSWNQSHGIIHANGSRQIWPIRGLYR